MVKAVQVHETGGPEVLTIADIDLSAPGDGEVQVRHTAIGLNYIDTYFRSGLYPAPAGLPFVPGNEAAGVVEAVGDGISGFSVGDRVAYAGPLGSYCEVRNMDPAPLVKIPEGVSDEQAAAMMLKGMTAQYLLRQTFRLEPGHSALFHAAAGGVGLIAGQWARHLGIGMIGTASSQAKIDLALAHGYEHMINYSDADFVEEVKRLTDGKGVDVVYDSVGKDTFPGSLDCLKPLGMWVSFGQSSGALPEINLGILSQKGSLFATRPTLFAYISTREALEACAGELFDVVASGAVKIDVKQTYRLDDAVQAHIDLQGRKTTGATVLVP
ncbi:MAG: quinone oxidoreductase [Pseudomonadota bacterium]